MWPSAEMADMAVARLAANGKEDSARHLCFEDAGHSFMPWAPGGSKVLGAALDALRLRGFGGVFDLGGRPSANREALREAWSEAVQFLREHLVVEAGVARQ